MHSVGLAYGSSNQCGADTPARLLEHDNMLSRSEYLFNPNLRQFPSGHPAKRRNLVSAPAFHLKALNFVRTFAMAGIVCSSSAAQVFGPPLPFERVLADVRPDLSQLARKEVIKHEVVDSLEVLEKPNLSLHERERALGLISNGDDVPDEILRYAFFQHTHYCLMEGSVEAALSAARTALSIGEMRVNHEAAAGRDATKYQADAHLRMEIARIIEDIVNADCQWSSFERLQLLNEFLLPLFDASIYDQSHAYVIKGQLQYFRALDKWLDVYSAGIDDVFSIRTSPRKPAVIRELTQDRINLAADFRSRVNALSAEAPSDQGSPELCPSAAELSRIRKFAEDIVVLSAELLPTVAQPESTSAQD